MKFCTFILCVRLVVEERSRPPRSSSPASDQKPIQRIPSPSPSPSPDRSFAFRLVMSHREEPRRSLLCSKKYGEALFASAWIPDYATHGVERETSLIVLAGGRGKQRSGLPNRLLLARYNSTATVLTDALHTLLTGDDAPSRLAVHSSGAELLCSVGSECRLFEVVRGDGSEGAVKLVAAERSVQSLKGAGVQNALVFSPDGSRLAAGGDDGRLRVVEWGTSKVLVDKAGAHESIKDLDFSLDGTRVASTSGDGACRIWDVESGGCVASLPVEGIGFVRFTRDGNKQLLYVAVRKRGMGFVSAFDTNTWKEVSSRKLQDDPISAFAMSPDGRYLAVGSSEGDISIVDASNPLVCQKVKRAHRTSVTSMEFSPKGGALLSVSADSSARVTAVTPRRGGGSSWQGSLLLLLIFFLSMLLVIVGEKVFMNLASSLSRSLI